jgi:hypothetical protein
VSWDRSIPIPTKTAKWDFASADVGYSKAFETRDAAVKFAGALRKWATANGKPWGALLRGSGTEWRVWIVERRERIKKTVIYEPVKPVMLKPLAFNVIVNEDIIGQNIAPSTDTDDDIMLSVDTRKAGGVTIGKQPEAVPVDVADEITPTGRRKRRGKEG